MAGTLEDFHEVLRDEVHVDLARLREMAMHGIPTEVRLEAWRHLLGAGAPELVDDSRASRDLLVSDYEKYSKDNFEFGRQVKYELEHSGPRTGDAWRSLFKNTSVKRAIANVINVYLNCHDVPFSPELVSFCYPLVAVFGRAKKINEAELSAMYRALMAFTAKRSHGRGEELSRFLGLFRSHQAELAEHFDDEELEPSAWAVRWLQGYFVREVELEDAMLLWDYYLSSPDGFSFHPYVCLAVLATVKEDLDDLEQTDIVASLNRLPPLQISEVLATAETLKQASRDIV